MELSQALVVPSTPPEHLPQQHPPSRGCPSLAALPLPWLGCLWWTAARPSPGAGPHGQRAFTAASARPGQEQGGQWAPSAAAIPPRRSLPGSCSAPRLPGLAAAAALARSSCRPRPRPQAHLLPSRPLSLLPPPDLLGAFPPTVIHAASLARMLSVQVGSPTVLCVRLPVQDGLGVGFRDTLPRGWRLEGCAPRWGLSGPLGNAAEPDQ